MNRCFSYPSSLGGVYQPARIKVIHGTLRNQTNWSGEKQKKKNETSGRIYIKTRALRNARTKTWQGVKVHAGDFYIHAGRIFSRCLV